MFSQGNYGKSWKKGIPELTFGVVVVQIRKCSLWLPGAFKDMAKVGCGIDPEAQVGVVMDSFHNDLVLSLIK